MRFAGIQAANATHMLLLDRERTLLPGALEAIVDAQRLGYASVTGAVELDAAGTFPSARALYRFGADRPRRGNAILDGAPRWASVSRSLLLEVSERDRLDEIVALRTLATRGYLTYAIGASLLKYRPHPESSSMRALSDAFGRGGSVADFFQREYEDRGELLNRRLLKEQLLKQLPRRLKRTRSRASSLDLPARTTLAAAALETAQWSGQWIELLKPGGGQALTLIGRPGGLAFVALLSAEEPRFALVRFDLRTPALRIVLLPPGLRVPLAVGGSESLTALLSRASIGRFDIQDAIGRPFELDVDDFIVIDESRLTAEQRELLERAIHGVVRSPRELLSLNALLDESSAVTSSFSRIATWLGLMRLRAISREQIDLIALPAVNDELDADSVAMAVSFLDVDSIRRPSTRRNQLKMIEWA
jgi:hypothetical protein